jgi:hypothetical protein
MAGVHPSTTPANYTPRKSSCNPTKNGLKFPKNLPSAIQSEPDFAKQQYAIGRCRVWQHTDISIGRQLELFFSPNVTFYSVHTSKQTSNQKLQDCCRERRIVGPAIDAFHNDLQFKKHHKQACKSYDTPEHLENVGEHPVEQHRVARL